MKLATIAAGVALVASLGLSAAAQAQTPWQYNHPWRTYDNARLANQNMRITQGVRDGQLSYGQARALRADDHAIRAEERADASLHGGQQENANSRAIYYGRHH